MGEDPDARHPAVLLLSDGEVGASKIEVEVKEVRIGARVKVLGVLMAETVQNTRR